MFLEKTLSKLTTAYRWTDQRTGGVLGIIANAFTRFDRERGSEGAASISYYAIFSIVPLLLLLSAILGFILTSTADPKDVIRFLTQAIPSSQALISENFLQILEQRNITGIIGLVGLIWSASGVFFTLTRNVNRAWPGTNERNFIKGRLLAVGIIAILILLLVLWTIVTAALNLLNESLINLTGGLPQFNFFLSKLVFTLLPWLLAFIIFINIYRWLPNTHVRWREAFWGAAFATTAWEITTRIFVLIVQNGFASYELIYGSLGTSLALLTWVYISTLIALFGAHLSASVALATRLKDFVSLEAEKEAQ